MYFKDSWDFAFDPLSDEDDNSFDPGNGRDKINVKMMLRQSKSFHLTDTFVFEGILPTVQFRAISMPYAYGDGRKYEMVISMPTDDANGLAKLEQSLDLKQDGGTTMPNIIDKIMNELQEIQESTSEEDRKEVILTMPEFSVVTDVDVIDNLRMMGINAAFDAGQFDEITNGVPLRVTGVKHKAMVEVTPKGTEAAAATAIELVPLFGNFDTPKEFTINKPFIFFINDIVHQTPIFSGKVSHPTLREETN